MQPALSAGKKEFLCDWLLENMARDLKGTSTKRSLCQNNKATTNLVPKSHSVTGNVRSGNHFSLGTKKRQCNLRSDWLISRGT